MRHTLSQVARQPPATEQIVGWNSSSVSRTQSLLQLPSRENGPPRLPIGVSPARPPQINPRQFSDPLQNELIRIKREEEQVMKMHEEEKVKLNNECEKQIEEIRKKYNNMLEEAELDLGQKKKALETNYNIVYMNKILADAFRMKCDARNSSGLQPQQQGT
ncbi:DNA helicase [Ranunculus cassubicifolius]